MPAPLPHRTALLAALVASLICPATATAATADSAERPDTPAKKAPWDVNHPPGEARTAQIDTRTGTWMSVDVSPDGKTLVFDLLGDLYLLPIEGGEARPLTHSIAWDQQARFSPDGRQIAYLSDAEGGDNVWVMNVDGSGARAVSHEDYRLLNNPVWHPNGRFIAARKHYTGTRSAGSGEIWLYHVSGDPNGSKGVQLNEKPNWQKDLGEPAISPDGKFLYYSHDATPGKTFQYNKNAHGEIFKIYRQSLEDGSVEPFVQGPGGAIRPTPSPDGRYLAFVRRVRNQSTLFLKNLATGEERAAWGGLERDLQEAWSVYGVYPAFAWTPDARHIVVWAQGKLWRVDPFNGRATDIPFHVKDTRELRPALRVAQPVAPAQFPVRQLRSAHVAPGGERVVYSALGQLWMRELQGPQEGGPRRLTRADNRFEFFPSFSRDGRSVVFTAWNDETLGRVVKLDIASGRETVLTPQPGKYLHPRFSPDGATVVYEKVAGGGLTSPWHSLDLGIYLVGADGRQPPQRISKEGEDPQFGDRNDAVYLTRASMSSEVESVRKLVRIDLADRQETEIARSEYASEYAVSPDGQWLGFVERFHAYVVPLARVGKGVSVGPKADALPLRQLDANAGHTLHWSGDSQQLHFTLGDELFTTPLAQAFAPGSTPKAPTTASGRKIGFMQAADVPQGQVALVGARIATLRGTLPDEVIDNGVVLVEGNRIAAVGPAAQVAIPPSAKRIDLRGKTVIPGLIDAHWHGRMGDDEIIPQQSWINHASLAFGVTTLHDPSNRNSEVFTQAELQRAGRVLGPRIYSTGSVLYGAKAGITAVVNGLDDALTHLKRQQAEGAISVKSYNQPRRDQRQQLLEAARQTGMMVVPEGGSLFQANMGMVVDGHTGIEHALPVAEVYDDVKQLWPQTQVGYTPTLNVAYGGLDGEHYWYARTNVWEHPLLSRHVPASVLQARAVRRETAPEDDFNVIRVARTATALQRLGVKVNIGAHGQREGLGAHWEMWMLALGGMTPLEAIRAATLNPAHYLGLDRDLGSIEPGKLADLVVIDGDVLADIRQSDRVVQVMQNGRLYDAATLDELWPRQVKRKPRFFDGAAGVGMPVEADSHAHSDD